MSSKELCKDLVGKRAILLRDVASGRTSFSKGDIVRIYSTHRGRYAIDDGNAVGPMIRGVSRSAFRIIPNP